MVSGSLVERIAGAFGAFAERYRRFFATRARDNSAVAERYLQGLTQARECTFEEMSAMVATACPHEFQHFIGLVARIGRLAARSGRYKRASPFLAPDSHRAIQSEPISPSSHPEAAAQSDELGGL